MFWNTVLTRYASFGALIACLILAPSALGDLTLVGDIENSNSWFIRAYDSGYGGAQYDLIGLRFVSGLNTEFEVPTFKNLGSGWSNYAPINTGLLAAANGPALTGQLRGSYSGSTFTMHFTNSFPTSAGVVIEWYAFGPASNTALEAGRINIVGPPDNWSYTSINNPALGRMDFIIPAPAAVFLGIGGVALLNALRRRLA